MGKREREAKYLYERVVSFHTEKKNENIWGHLNNYEKYQECNKLVKEKGWMYEKEFVKVYLLNYEIFESCRNIASIIICEGIDSALNILSEKERRKVQLNILKSKLS